MVGGVIHVYFRTHSLKIVGWFVFPCSGMAQPASLGKPQSSRWTPEKNMIKYDKCVHILWKVSVFFWVKMIGFRELLRLVIQGIFCAIVGFPLVLYLGDCK
jgi:hypothetical protein